MNPTQPADRLGGPCIHATSHPRKEPMSKPRHTPAANGKQIVGYDTIGRPIWRSAITPIDKLMARVTVVAGTCHPWTGCLTEKGYGTISIDGSQRYAHRVAYELLVGPIPDGLHIDHTCHTNDQTCQGGPTCLHRRCCNPEHLEPVAPAENTRRGVLARRTHCPQGHPYDEENTFRKRGPRSKRECRECARERSRRKYREKTHCDNGHELADDNVIVRADGIRWCRTCREAWSTGERGERNPCAKLKDADIPVILQRVAQGHSRAAIAADFGVAISTIGRVVKQRAA